MPITSIEIDDYMRVRHAAVQPHTGVNEITGENGAGKTSFLEAIATLGGKENVAWKPVRSGAQEARITIAMDGVGEMPIKMVRRFYKREDGTTGETLHVEGPGGARFQKPQSILDAVVGQFSFDPLSLIEMDQKRFMDILRRFVPDFDFDAQEKARKQAFDDRTDVNRDLKNLKSQVAGFSIPADTPDEEIDISALSAELQAVGEHNAQVEQRKANREKVADEAVRLRLEADSLDQQAADYRRLANEAEERAKALRQQAEENDQRLADAGPLPEAKDASAIRARIERANAVNSAVRDKVRRDLLVAKAAEVEQQANALTNEIERLDSVKATAISSAKMPVEGLGFADDYITLNGLPFEQASSAEQLRASIGIAIAANPKLRVLIVRDGALLDDESMRIVAEMAEANDVQIWVESVQSGRPSAVVIEDGMVVGAEEAEAA